MCAQVLNVDVLSCAQVFKYECFWPCVQVFKQLFLESLGAQKEEILELRKYAKEQREKRAKKQKDELESIEN